MIGPIALAWHRNGFCAVPVRSDGSKAPGLNDWKEFQKRLPNETELRNWWANPERQGFGLIMGAVSGNAEMLEFEGRAVDLLPQVLQSAADADGDVDVKAVLVKLWTGYRELTPSGGIHLVFRVSDGPALGNTKLARAVNADVLIETRGEGGFTVTAPSNGTTHPSGGAWTLQAGQSGVVPTITCAERDALYDLLRSFDEMPQAAQKQLPRKINSDNVFGQHASAHVSPLDAFNEHGNWADILTPHGWKYDHNDDAGTSYWIRPGKDTPGFSATTGRSDTGDRLYVFSTSTPFEAETPMSKAFVWAHYNHGGDMQAARAALYEAGWGDRRRDTQSAIGGIDRPWFLDEEFWTARPVFEHLRRAAWSRMASPEGVLVAALCLTLYYAEPNMILSAPVGSEAPINLLATLCGNPSDGKSVCRKLALQALDFVDAKPLHMFSPSSGQGIAKQYQFLRKPRGQEPYMEKVRTAAFALAEEIDSIKAQSSMQGSTLSSELRKAAMGETLGAGNVGETATNLPEGTYRFVMLVCTQPELAGWLLDGAAGGLPQRFLWCSVRDPRIVDDIEFPEPMHIRLPFEARPEPSDGFSEYGQPRHRWVMQGTPAIWGEIRAAAREAKMSSDDDVTLDGHALLTRRKVSAALALLDGRNNDNDEDWELARQVMEMSDASREWVQSRVMIAAARENEQKSKARGRGRVIENRTVAEMEQDLEESLTEAVVEFVREHPGSTLRDVKRGPGKRKGAADKIETLVQSLINDGDLRREEDVRTVRLYVVETE